MSMTLISHALCPYVQRAVIALKEKNVSFERIDIDLNAKPDWFLAISPLGKTPVLQVNEGTIFESAVICEYLDDTIAPVLHPADPFQRAQHRAWIEFASATLSAIWIYYTAKDDAGYRNSLKAVQERFSQIEKTLTEGPYFAGENFSLVDAAFAPVFRYFDVFDKVLENDLLGALPKTKAWRLALAARASVQAAVGSDYEARLQQFVIKQNSYLGSLLSAV